MIGPPVINHRLNDQMFDLGYSAGETNRHPHTPQYPENEHYMRGWTAGLEARAWSRFAGLDIGCLACGTYPPPSGGRA